MNYKSSKSQVTESGEDASVEYELGVPISGTILSREHWVQTAIKRLPAKGPMDWTSVFGRSAPLVLDIGCGNGRFVISSAVRRPETDHIGIDMLPVVIRYATRRGNQRGLSNVRFSVCDGFRFLTDYLASGSIDEIHIYHPQPFHSDEDRHLRLMTPSFLRLVHQVLKPRGLLFLQTDSEAYWKYIRMIVPSFFSWHDQLDPWAEDPNGRSRREIMAAEQNLPIYRAFATRRDDLDEAQMDAAMRDLPQPNFSSTAPRKPQSRRKFRRR
ncbi:MAG: methyltransferase domain-containing protein [Pirellulaceae bacterium]|nr:methyltransferase domain-containing protein [Pirellulaceae bacterium]